MSGALLRDAALSTHSATFVSVLKRMASAVRLPLHTVRYLKLRQIAYLPVRRIQALLPATLPRVEVERNPRLVPADLNVLFPPGDEERTRRADQVLSGWFEFGGHTVAFRGIDWNAEYAHPLFTYHLHYFDFAVDLASAYRDTGERRYAEAFVELAMGWIRSTSPRRGVGWQPYPTALRIVNWIHALLLTCAAIDEHIVGRIERSIAMQAAWLRRRIEYHIDANHLQKNYKALAIAGIYFGGNAAKSWRQTGIRGTWTSVLEHVNADGVHFERSPMYHAIALRDFLEIVAWAAAAGEAIPVAVTERIGRMLAATAALSRPDGSYHLINDTADGVASDAISLEKLGRALTEAEVRRGREVIHLPHGGFYGAVAPERGLRLLIDGGGPSPAFQPSHAHCGVFSFELDLHDRRVVVDSGVSGYGKDSQRPYFRSTRAHSTVMVDGREQSEIWGVFRMARRVRDLRVAAGGSADEFWFAGEYRAYYGRVRHARRIQLSGDRLRVEDRIAGAAGLQVVSFLHLHPDWEVTWREGDTLIATAADGDVIRINVFGAERTDVGFGSRTWPEGWYSPRFGCAMPAPVVAISVPSYDGRTFGYELRSP